MTILIVGVLLIIYGLIARKKYSVWVGMAFVLLIMGFQEGVPGDYYAYKSLFWGGVEGGLKGFSIKENEFSYIWLVNTCRKVMSFHWFVLLTSLVQCIIMALMIKKNADERYSYFGVLLIFFTFNIMLLQMKAMRQGYAVEMMLLAYLLLGQRRFLLSLLSILLAYGFHNSMLIALPFYFILFIYLILDKKSKRSQSLNNAIKSKAKKTLLFPILIGVFFLITYYLGNNILAGYITPFLTSLELFEYESFTEQLKLQNAVAFWIIIYYLLSTFAVAYYYTQEKDKFRRFLALLMIIANYITIVVIGYGDIQRIVMYFIPFSIVVFPNIAAMIEDKNGKPLATGYVLFNMVFLIYISSQSMLSVDFRYGSGFGSYVFSFLNW